MSPLDSRTPVIVGVGQYAERIGEPTYRRLSAVDLAAAAASAALEDAGGDRASIGAAIDTVAGVRQFENSWNGAPAPLGRSDNFPRSVATRLGLTPGRAVLEVGGGQSPQHLINEFARTVAEGGSSVALVFGAEAISTARHFAGLEDRPDFSEHAEGTLEDRGFGLDGLVSDEILMYHLGGAIGQYALFENARRQRIGVSRSQYNLEMAQLFQPFTRVASQNPYSASPVERSVEELATPTSHNRPLSDPYTRYLVARDQVNQGAAVLLTSVDAARRLHVPEEQWIFVHGHCDLKERTLLERADLSSGPASIMAAQHALEVAGITTDDVAFFDLYSCFPIAVFNMCDGLNIATDDPRGLTVTGGLPYFGGPGNNYSMHAIAEMTSRLRTSKGTFGFVGANGGLLSKYSVGVYSSRAVGWTADESSRLQSEIDRWPAPGTVTDAQGWGVIETYTVRHGRTSDHGIVVGRQETDGRRFLASAAVGDDELATRLRTGEPIGTRVFVRPSSSGNLASSNEVG